MRETVQEKGIRLWRAGRVRRHLGDKYLVQGDGGTHEVDAAKQTCTCESRLYCSHRAATEIQVAKENARTAWRLEELRARESRRPEYSAEGVERNLERFGGVA